MFDIDSILIGPFWKERVRVISCRLLSEGMIKLEAVGVDTNNFYDPVLSEADISLIEVVEEGALQFSGDGEGFFLFTEAHRIRNAFQFDPLYAVNVSQIDPLPHQIDAVYYHTLLNPRIRFLLADDPGAGKTIMAGLIIKELKYRGLVKRILIVAPGHLKYQWLREMKEKFQEKFIIVDRNVMDSTWGQNIFDERDQIITSIDFAKQEDIMYALKGTCWDLVIVDEAHKMSAYKYGEKISKTARYKFGELISEITNFLLFLTATPHRGDPENFRLFLDLLEPGFFSDVEMLSQSIRDKDNPLFLRRLKEDMTDFDKAPLFPPRHVHTMKFNLSDDEKELYNAVTKYVETHFNKALQKEKRNVTFAMVILQRRLASSVRAIRKSLERRRKRLQDLYDRGELFAKELNYTENYLEDLEEIERWKKEEELLEKLTSAGSLEELKEEIDVLDELIELAKIAEKKEIETKLNELKRVIEDKNLKGSNTKLLIFTESRDTLEYLLEKLNIWGYQTTKIHGGMNMDQRIQAEKDFFNESQICVATEAAGEGINLQFCSFMVNYDIPWNPNRLEQRMGRIHRYGQQHEVYIYNLVAKDTREGKILIKLFEKLDRMKEQMGSDRVFDVIGDVWGTDKNLSDLIIDAISNQRTMEEILSDFDRIPDEEAIQKIRDATMETLSTHHIDLHRIIGEQRKAKESRLVPEYIEAYFIRAAEIWELNIQKRTDDFYRIDSVPFEVRNRSVSFKNQFGEIQNKYSKVSFDKQHAFKGQGEFIAMGHPLLEGIIEANFGRFANTARNGAVFVDPAGQKDGVLWILKTEIKDGNNQIAGQRLFGVFQSRENEIQFVNPGILWDLKPMPAETRYPALSNINQDEIVAYVINEGLSNYKQEIFKRRQHDADIKEKYGLRSLNSLIAKSEEKLAEYATKKMLGEKVVEATVQREKKKREDLEKKRINLQNQIKAEIHLLSSEPKIICAARVIPETTIRPELHSSKEIELVGMRVAMDFEKKQGRLPEDVSDRNLGYDIFSSGENEFRYIEVKARAEEGNVLLTPNEWLMAQRLGNEYWLYIITKASSGNPELYTIVNPASKLEPNQVIDVVRYVVSDWKSQARKEI